MCCLVDNYYHVKICLCNGLVGYICEMRLNPRCVGVKSCPLKAKNFIWPRLLRVLLILCVRETLCDVYIISVISFSVYWTPLLYLELGILRTNHTKLDVMRLYYRGKQEENILKQSW